jgi:hypothetical protein
VTNIVKALLTTENDEFMARALARPEGAPDPTAELHLSCQRHLNSCTVSILVSPQLDARSRFRVAPVSPI